jgi:hypothetical protein
MRIAGEFIIADEEGNEHVVPNQFTTIGIQQVLKSAFWAQVPHWYMGLCAHNPGDSIPLISINEPVGNGYSRQDLAFGITNWPTIGNINGESYIQTRDCTFALTGPTSVEVNRLFITDGEYVIAISAAMQGGLQNLNGNVTQKYRLYFR